MSPPPMPLDALSAAQRERLAYIEFRLWFLGEVSRMDVLQRFGIATAAGTRDLVLYQELAPGNVAYIKKRHCYLPTFKPLFQHQVQRVLSALTSGFGDGERDTGNSLLPHDVPARLNQPQLAPLAMVTRAIHGGYPLKLKYYSMKRGLSEREIIPHALVDSGLRWHVRAYDRSKQEFRDLVLTRMEKISPLKERDPRTEVLPQECQLADVHWQRLLNMSFIPHPGHPHPESIMRDYGMTHGQLSVQVRAANAGHVLRQWQVDCSPDASLQGPEFRLRLTDLRLLDDLDNAVLAPGYTKL
ncbi:WYL domain-containing protein [Herbaspirillum sp. RTI4]|uniref:helix-turn-helix transcriptional regulator n=1 Tax=Herbaspirillum sp. RTI4 TaxID=3048640 RepID=UPI002AB5A82E|nr:WYL domain-containing protein [Herbaspirillum sp. RTI4]MDY7580093.1 WYL domain-containing protein [Herbaspirillum sp. RTI4]MEA9983126.1 WYL domain-containing protein [Herbaspirillum sp. RTI4]